MHYQYITVIHFDFKSHFAHSLLLHYYEAAVLKVDTSINMVRTGSKSCWWVHRFIQTVLISSWQLDVVEITQFNTHGCCVIIAALLSQWETSHLFNPVASLLFCKPLADWRRWNLYCLSFILSLINHLLQNISNSWLLYFCFFLHVSSFVLRKWVLISSFWKPKLQVRCMPGSHTCDSMACCCSRHRVLEKLSLSNAIQPLRKKDSLVTHSQS